MSIRTALDALDGALWTDGGVYITPLKTQDDVIYACCECELSDEQKELVNPAWFSIGRAYLCPDDNCPCIIRNERMERIGFINLCRWLGKGDCCSWSFFIDKKHQGKGYGKRAAKLAVRILKAAEPNKTIKLSTEESNEKAQKLYASLGFMKLDELDGDDLVFEL